MTPTPEELAREQIDVRFRESGWAVQDRDAVDLTESRGVAVREMKMEAGHGFVDYLLFVDGHAVGVFEAKPDGHTLSGVEHQARKYSEGLPSWIKTPIRPLPFMYVGTGTITRLTNLLDPEPRSRRIFQIHRPETLADWMAAESLMESPSGQVAEGPPSSLRGRIRAMPPLDIGDLWPNKIKAITNLEQSLSEDRPRSLIQMATGSGKTLTAITSIYRLIKFGGARRVLFLVDRTNLGEQAEKEFQGYRTPDDNRKFTDLYNVQRLAGSTIGSSTKVVISTIQRLYSMLTGNELDPDDEEGSQFESGGPGKEPLPVSYNPTVPPEYFDVIIIDECHRSIYSVWGQVLEYFDAFLIGLTATPAAHTYGYFHQNLVMEYGHEEAVADGVNVDFDVYKIRTRISEQGSVIAATSEHVVGKRDLRTHKVRWEAADEPIAYDAKKLDRAVVAKDQIRTVIQTFRDKIRTEIFPGRKEVPKTLIFAKSDRHAEDIVETVLEEFGKGSEFCRKITYKVTGTKPADLIQEFRTSFNPRIAVTVDLVATGTDIKPVEVVMFMRSVKSRVLFEQMKGRGVRIIDKDTLKSVTPDAGAKTHFVIVDCVGVTESDLEDSQQLERKKSVPLKQILEHVAFGGTDPDTLSSLASRLARMHKRATEEQRQKLLRIGEGTDITAVSHAIVEALDPDRQRDEARRTNDVAEDQEPTEEQVEQAATTLLKQAAAPLASKPKLRKAIEELQQQFEQIIDIVSEDEVLEAGVSEEAKAKAKDMTQSFEEFLKDNKDKIDALHFFFDQPYAERPRFEDLKNLANEISKPPRSWTPEQLWHAYELVERDKVKGVGGQRLLADIVSLIRYALRKEDELVPYADKVHDRFDHWLNQQRQAGREFTPDQLRWLEMIRDHVANSLAIETADFSETPFVEQGGLGRARQVFGDALGSILKELNEELAA